MAYTPVFVRNGIYNLQEGDKTKNLILIHGLNGDGAFDKDDDQMRGFYQALDDVGALSGYTVWALRYNTVFMPFDISGNWLANELKQLQGYDFSEAIVVGYSMGGLIGRVLVSNGLNFKYLVTIDTPHHGPTKGLDLLGWAAYFVFPISIVEYVLHGLDSLIWGSGSHNFIHGNSLDQAKRKTSYAFYAIDYRKNEQDAFHGDDCIVPVESQLGMDVGEVRWRSLWKKTYSDDKPWTDHEPHTVASHPENCQDVLDLVKDLLAGKPMPQRTLDTKPNSSETRTESYGLSKPPLDIQGWTAWYWFDKDNVPQLRLRLQVTSTSDKPVRMPFSAFFTSEAGSVRALEATPDLMLVPKKSRDIVFAIDHPNGELMPETIEIVSFGELKKIPLLFVPLEVDAAEALPQESIWQLGLEAKATSNLWDDGSFTNVTVSMSVDNPSPCTYYLDHRCVDIRCDVTSAPYYTLLGDSDVTADKRVRIAPATKTEFTVAAQWSGSVGTPHKVRIVLGGGIMPAAELEVVVAA